MREIVRPVVTALSIACLAASMAIVSSGSALAQAKQQMAPAQAAPPQDTAVKQIALTEKQVQGVLAAGTEMDAITAKVPPRRTALPATTSITTSSTISAW